MGGCACMHVCMHVDMYFLASCPKAEWILMELCSSGCYESVM